MEETNFFKAEEERIEKEYKQFFLEDTCKKTQIFKQELSLRQADRRKLYKIFGDWFFTTAILATICYSLFKTPKFQTINSIIIIGIFLFEIYYTIQKLRLRKNLRKKLKITKEWR